MSYAVFVHDRAGEGRRFPNLVYSTVRGTAATVVQMVVTVADVAVDADMDIRHP
jgi:hypothetical protein